MSSQRGGCQERTHVHGSIALDGAAVCCASPLCWYAPKICVCNATLSQSVSTQAPESGLAIKSGHEFSGVDGSVYSGAEDAGSSELGCWLEDVSVASSVATLVFCFERYCNQVHARFAASNKHSCQQYTCSVCTPGAACKVRAAWRSSCQTPSMFCKEWTP